MSYRSKEDVKRYNKQYRKKHRNDLLVYDRIRWPKRKHQAENQRLKRKFGITQEKYDQMFEEQGGVCKICKKPESRICKGILSKLAVDHNHKTKKVRGLLCSKCNGIIGMSNESIDVLLNAIKYLREDKF